MPILDAAARLRSLQNDYGPTRGPNAPDSFTVELWVGDPELDSSYEMPETTELEDLSVVPNGYAAPTISSDDFTVDDLGVSQDVSFADALEEWPDTATHWLLRDTVTGQAWDSSMLSEQLDVTAAGPVQPIQVTVFYGDDITTGA